VKVFTGKRVLTQYNDGKSGHLSQSSLPLYFGLGDAAAVERVELVWPSGRKQVVEKNIPVNKMLTITESKE
jgi:hypothetical protein